MAKFTINVMGIEQEKGIMNIIMQSVSREGKYELPARNNVQPEDLMANKLVNYKVLTRNLVRNYPKATDVYEYNAGENFAQAEVKGAQKFLEEEKKRITKKKPFLTTYQYIYLPIFMIFGCFGIYKSFFDKDLKSNYEDLKVKHDSLEVKYKHVVTKFDSLEIDYNKSLTAFDSLAKETKVLETKKTNDTLNVKN
jgi:hypothetical protein